MLDAIESHSQLPPCVLSASFSLTVPAAPQFASLTVSRANRLLRVKQINVETPDVGRLKALGICVGRCILVERAGDPLVVRASGARIGLAASLASGVLVEEMDC